MGERIIRTGVDELLDLLNSGSKISVTEASEKLKIPTDVLQSWVDFLVEEGIVGIEYKFTTPYIYINKPLNKVQEKKEETVKKTLYDFKNEFWIKAKEKNIPEGHIEPLWKNHLLQELESKKKYFYYEANNRRLKKIDSLWEEYKEKLMSV